MKKVVVSSLISVLILILIAGGFIYLQKFRSETSSALEAVPADVAWLLSCDPSSGDLRQLANTGFFSGADTVNGLKQWKQALIKFDSIAVNTPDIKQLFKANPLIVTGHVTGPRTFSTVYLVNLGSTNAATVTRLVQKLSGQSAKATSRNYNGADIREFTREDGSVLFAYVISKGIFIGSGTAYLVEDALRQQRTDKLKSPAVNLESLLRDAQRKSVVAIRYEGFEKWLQTNLANGAANLSELQKIGEWTAMRLDIHTNQLTFSGNTTVSDSTQFLYLFKDQKPVLRKLNKHLLSRTAAFVSWGFSNPSVFFGEYGRMLDQDVALDWEGLKVDSLRSRLAGFLNQELGLLVVKPINGQKDYHYFALASLRNNDSCLAVLGAISRAVTEKSIPEEHYNGTVIHMIPGQGLLPVLYGPLFSKISRFYYTVLDSTLIVTNQVSALRSYINDYRLGNFLAADNRFHSLESPLPSVSNLYFYCSIPQSEKLFASVAAPQWTSWLAKYSSSIRSWNGLTLAISSQGGMYKTTAGLGYFQDTLNIPQTIWKKDLDTTIVAGPFMPGNGSLVFVQDKRNKLTVIGPDGAVKWQQQLESRIQSEIFFNSAEGTDTTYLFNTFSFIYQVKSDGSASKGFPVQLPAAASAGMAFLKMPDAAQCRLYIPCLNMKLLAYNLSGKYASGYSAFRLRQVVRNRPVILAQQNSILLHGEKSGGYLVSLSGNIVHTIRQDVVFAPGTNFFADTLSAAGYAWLTPDGNYVRGGKDGIPVAAVNITDGDSITGAARIDLNGDGAEDWLFTLASGLRGSTADGVSLFVFTSENPLLAPAVISQKGKTLFAATDNSRIYVFNRNGSLYEGFPVAGNGIPVFATTAGNQIGIVFINDNKTVQLMQFR
jgi:hypothetical protein